jgi:hypothetical protein
MWITYRRTGSALGLLAAVLPVAVLTVAVGAFAVIAAVVLAPVALLVRAMRPAPKRNRRARSTSSWPHETIEAEVVSATSSSDERDLQRLESDKG